MALQEASTKWQHQTWGTKSFPPRDSVLASTSARLCSRTRSRFLTMPSSRMSVVVVDDGNEVVVAFVHAIQRPRLGRPVARAQHVDLVPIHRPSDDRCRDSPKSSGRKSSSVTTPTSTSLASATTKSPFGEVASAARIARLVGVRCQCRRLFVDNLADARVVHQRAGPGHRRYRHRDAPSATGKNDFPMT